LSFDLTAIRTAIARNGPVVRVVVAATEGSVPREVGAAMLVWRDGQSGTIGGGTLEFEAAAQARAMLAAPTAPSLRRIPLGPSLGQCCGGAVTVLSEHLCEADLLDGLNAVHARQIEGSDTPPLELHRLLNSARAQGIAPPPQLIKGWMVEPISRTTAPLWIFGAGHVGRALVHTLAPLTDLSITWAGTRPERFPAEAPEGVTVLPTPNPTNAVALAPKDAHHLILTYSHTLDLELCHRLLSHGFQSAGLIGSATKWARFRSRLGKLGHTPAQISRICCPIGQPELGKHPQAIAVGVAAALLSTIKSKNATNTKTGGATG